MKFLLVLSLLSASLVFAQDNTSSKKRSLEDIDSDIKTIEREAIVIAATIPTSLLVTIDAYAREVNNKMDIKDYEFNFKKNGVWTKPSMEAKSNLLKLKNTYLSQIKKLGLVGFIGSYSWLLLSSKQYDELKDEKYAFIINANREMATDKNKNAQIEKEVVQQK